MAPAHDHRNVSQLRAVSFLDRGVESITVEMGEGQTVKLLVPCDARRTAGRADSGFGRRPAAAIAAQGAHDTIIGLEWHLAKLLSATARSLSGAALLPSRIEHISGSSPWRSPPLSPERQAAPACAAHALRLARRRPQVLAFNPASSVRGPQHVVKTGKTGSITAEC